ncbi:MAG: HD domain-containing protein [bacterium]|nr:HD domain-containing protein [bacterium]
MNKQNFPNIKELFKDFTGREQKLRAITRYSLYSPMFYRTNLYTHSQRVAWITHSLSENIKQAFGNTIDIKKAIIMAMIHDDPEIIMGDYQSGVKLKMSDQELKKIDEIEIKAIQKITSQFPKQIANYNYQELQKEIFQNKSPEAKLLKLTDRLEAFNEALHEIYGGNPTFAINVTNEYGKILTPFEQYVEYLTKFPEIYPGMKPLYLTESPFLLKPSMLNFKKIAETNNPHSPESLKLKTGYPIYDHWKSIVIHYANEEEYKNLYLKKE